MRIKIIKEVLVPDPIKSERCLRVPELGPRILFFSGGTALRELSQEIIHYTHNTTHIITPFDSGGSSAVIRKAFGMPAVGDLRNRLMALADKSVHGNPAIFDLFTHRLPVDRDQAWLQEELDRLVKGRHELISAIPNPMRKIIRHYLLVFQNAMPAEFDLRGASIGNLVLTGGYLENDRHIDPVLYIFSKLVEVRGTVRPVVNKDLHLRAELADGSSVLGQHRMTGKNAPPLRSRITGMELVHSLSDPTPATASIRNKIRKEIKGADLICYPMGSLFTSIIANFQPQGVGTAISEQGCPKVYVPNTSPDPETMGMTLTDQVQEVLDSLRSDDPDNIAINDVLNFVLVDENDALYRGGVDPRAMLQRGLKVIRCPLVTEKSAPHPDPKLLCEALIALV